MTPEPVMLYSPTTVLSAFHETTETTGFPSGYNELVSIGVFGEDTCSHDRCIIPYIPVPYSGLTTWGVRPWVRQQGSAAPTDLALILVIYKTLNTRTTTSIAKSNSHSKIKGSIFFVTLQHTKTTYEGLFAISIRPSLV